MDKQKYNVLDLFSGAGGMSEGFLQAGFLVPLASDFSEEAANTYLNRKKQLGYTDTKFFKGDINELAQPKKLKSFIGDVDISVVVGGPPCQGFSLTGKRKKDDKRNLLFMQFLRIIKQLKPNYFVMENVEGILSYRIENLTGLSGNKYINELVPDIIKAESEKFGYKVQYKLLNAKNYGVPQNRPRVIFLGHKIRRNKKTAIDVVPPPSFPVPQNKYISVSEAISDLRFLRMGQHKTNYDNRYTVTEYQRNLRDGLTPDKNGKTVKAINLLNHIASKHTETTIERFRLLKPGESIDELLDRLDGEDYKKYFTKKYRCQRLHKDFVSPTVLTLPDDIIHYDLSNPRILSVRELARIQSFDDSFEFLGKRTTGGKRRKFETPQYTQVGNAVPPLFAKAIASEIMNSLVSINNSS